MGDYDDTVTFRLFTRPSFLEGVGRILDFGGALSIYNRSLTGAVADSRAIASDWRAVGRDLRTAMRAYGEQVEKQEDCPKI